jgi:hypothetical protein
MPETALQRFKGNLGMGIADVLHVDDSRFQKVRD